MMRKINDASRISILVPRQMSVFTFEGSIILDTVTLDLVRFQVDPYVHPEVIALVSFHSVIMSKCEYRLTNDVKSLDMN